MSNCFGRFERVSCPIDWYLFDRVLVAEVYESLGRHSEAIVWAQAELADPYCFTQPSRIRAGKVLGRCHTAMGQHGLAVAAVDAALDLAKMGFQLEAALVAQERVVAGEAAGGEGPHWDQRVSREQVAEAVGRLQLRAGRGPGSAAALGVVEQ